LVRPKNLSDRNKAIQLVADKGVHNNNRVFKSMSGFTMEILSESSNLVGSRQRPELYHPRPVFHLFAKVDVEALLLWM